MKKTIISAMLLCAMQAYGFTLNNSNLTKTFQKVDKAENNCTSDIQFFSIEHAFPDKDILFYIQSENFNVESTLHGLEEFPHQKVFKNRFTHPKQSIVTGAIHQGKIAADGSVSVKTLCGITFACKFTTENGYNFHVMTNGVGCRIADGGKGTQEQPYRITLL